VPVALAAAGCKATIPSGRFACLDDDDCPPGQRCVGDRCETGVGTDDGGSDADDAGARRDGRVDPTDAGEADGGSDAGATDSGGIDGGCAPMTRTFEVDGDSLINASECRGANHAGSSAFLNLGIGNGLFRFELPPQAQAALAEGRVVGARLVLHRDPDCITGCPAVAGMLRARPMRSDWDEGSDGVSTVQVDYAGCDWCRRVGGAAAPEGWGADGATQIGVDVGTFAGMVSFGIAEPSVVIALDPGDLADWTQFISGAFYLSIETVPAGGAFVVAARENPVEPPAELELDICE
jgi:hypothetical protein